MAKTKGTTATKAKPKSKENKNYTEQDIVIGFKFLNHGQKEFEVISFEKENTLVHTKTVMATGSYNTVHKMENLLEGLNNGLLLELNF